MSSVVKSTEQACSRCGVTKPWTPEFFYWRVKDVTLGRRCVECQRLATKESVERRRTQMGDEAFRRLNRERVSQVRARRGLEPERLYSRAYKRALSRLAEQHRDEFEEYLSEELEK